MLAILENAVEYFQKYLFAQNEIGRKLFQEAEEWLLEKMVITFCPLSLSARP